MENYIYNRKTHPEKRLWFEITGENEKVIVWSEKEEYFHSKTKKEDSKYPLHKYFRPLEQKDIQKYRQFFLDGKKTRSRLFNRLDENLDKSIANQLLILSEKILENFKKKKNIDENTDVKKRNQIIVYNNQIDLENKKLLEFMEYLAEKHFSLKIAVRDFKDPIGNDYEKAYLDIKKKLIENINK